jgi:peptidoglycan/LPS O-acetylase OafA/YrhL
MPVLIFFGDISYGLYLIHMLVFYAFNTVQDWLFPWAPQPKGHFEVLLVRFVVSFSIATLLAVISRRYFEEPFLKIKERLKSRRTESRDKQGLGQAPILS